MAVSEPDVDVLDSSVAGGVAIRGGALRTLAYVASMLLSLASVPFMTRHLGTVDYGYFVTVSSIIFIIGGITEAGLTYMGIREYAVLDGPARDLFLRRLVGLRLALTVRWYTRRDIVALVGRTGWDVQWAVADTFRGRNRYVDRLTLRRAREFLALQWHVLAHAAP